MQNNTDGIHIQILLANEIKYIGINRGELIPDEDLNPEALNTVICVDGKIIDCRTCEEVYELPLTYDGYVDNGIYTNTIYYTELYNFEPSDEESLKFFLELANNTLKKYLENKELDENNNIVRFRKRQEKLY